MIFLEKGSLFVLSGEGLTLEPAEIRALIETYSPESSCLEPSQRVVLSDLSEESLIEKVAERAAFCRFGGKLVARAGRIEDLSEDLAGLKQSGETFAVTSETVDRETYGNLGAVIKSKTNWKVSLESPDYLFDVEKIDGGFVLGVSSTGYKIADWRSRRPRARKFFLPSAIFPKLARLLVNLSRVKEGDLFLDPFCGTGSLLIESSLIGTRSVGVDLVRWIARGSLLNMKHFDLEVEGIIRSDSASSHLPFSRIDGVATDVPYGRAASTRGKETSNIIQDLSRNLGECLLSEPHRPRYCVIMHPSHVELKFDSKSFELAEQHLLYVHRTLTRAISVLRRTHT